jgi:hypothetical protein
MSSTNRGVRWVSVSAAYGCLTWLTICRAGRYREDSPDLDAPVDGPYPYNPNDPEAQRLLREQQLQDMLRQFPGTPNFRARPPWDEPMVMPYPPG